MQNREMHVSDGFEVFGIRRIRGKFARINRASKLWPHFSLIRNDNSLDHEERCLIGSLSDFDKLGMNSGDKCRIGASRQSYFSKKIRKWSVYKVEKKIS